MRRLIATALTCGLLTLGSASQTQGAVTLGHTFRPTEILGGETLAQTAAPQPGPIVGAPSAGVITSWSFEATNAAPTPPMKLKVLRAAASGYTTIYSGPLVNVALGEVNTFPVRIPVQAGDLIGNYYSDLTYSYRNDLGTGYHGIEAFVDAPVGSTDPYADNNNLDVDLAAALEPDADADGYGDETQDLCPSDASRHTACPDTDAPETTITKHPPDAGHKPKAKFKFISDEPSSTFECKLKGKGLSDQVKRFNACASPRKYKRLDPGTYRFKVRAIDSAKNADPTPAKDKFKVVD
jgi:hypothetical protein